MKNNLSVEKITELKKYYKDKSLLIIGLNDSQGVNVTFPFFNKGFLDHLAEVLISNNIKIELINAFSLMINKTEHIDSFLANNLSLKEIKLLQVYSAISAFEKVMQDIHLPKFFAKIGNIYKLVYKTNKEDEKIKITTMLKNASEPVLIYSSGANDLMRYCGANPFSLKSDYKNRDKKPNYNYTLEKIQEPQFIESILARVRENFDNILAINNNSDIYVLGAYIPPSLDKEETKIFNDVIIKYNACLKKLCQSYGISYIETEKIVEKYLKSKNNFHVSTAGHKALANYILAELYQNKIDNPRKKHNKNINAFIQTNKGIVGMIDIAQKNYENSLKNAGKLNGYDKVRELQTAEEYKK